MKSWLAFLANLMRSLATAQLARGSTWVCVRRVQAFALRPSSATGLNWEEVEDIRFPFPAEGQGAGGASSPWSLTSQLWKTSLRGVTDLSMVQGSHRWQKQKGTGQCPLGSLNGQPPPLLTLSRVTVSCQVSACLKTVGSQTGVEVALGGSSPPFTTPSFWRDKCVVCAVAGHPLFHLRLHYPLQQFLLHSGLLLPSF